MRELNDSLDRVEGHAIRDVVRLADIATAHTKTTNDPEGLSIDIVRRLERLKDLISSQNVRVDRAYLDRMHNRTTDSAPDTSAEAIDAVRDAVIDVVRAQDYLADTLLALSPLLDGLEAEHPTRKLSRIGYEVLEGTLLIDKEDEVDQYLQQG